MRALFVIALLWGAAVAFIPLLEAPARPSVALMVKRPQLKAAKKANRLRPKKHRLSDKFRTPPSYDVEPQFCDDRPPEFEVLAEAPPDFDKDAHIKACLERLAAEAAEEQVDKTDHELHAKVIAAIKYPDPAVAAVERFNRSMGRTGTKRRKK